MVWFLCPNVEHSWCFDSSIYPWFVVFCGGIGWGSKLERSILVNVFIFRNCLERYTVFEQYADFYRKSVHWSISVFHFVVRFRLEPRNGQSVDFDLPNQGILVNRWQFRYSILGLKFELGPRFWSTGGFRSSESGEKWFLKKKDLGFRCI